MKLKRYAQDRDGLPVFMAEKELVVVLAPKDFDDAEPRNPEACAIALGCKRQFASPYVHIMRSMSLVALPCSQGVPVEGYTGKWAHFRFQNNAQARKAIIQVDTGWSTPESTLVTLRPPQPADSPESRRTQNKNARRGGTHVTNKSRDVLTSVGVRNLSGKKVFA